MSAGATSTQTFSVAKVREIFVCGRYEVFKVLFDKVFFLRVGYQSGVNRVASYVSAVNPSLIFLKVIFLFKVDRP